MGRRGPPPKPTKLRALEGNPGKRPLNPREPQPAGLAHRPVFLTGAAAEEYDRAVASMPPGFFTGADEAVLTAYAMSWITYRNALALVARDGMIVRGADGAQAAHPMMAVIGRHAELILRASDRLGMSPAARSRLTMPEDAPPFKFSGLIGGKPSLRVVPPDAAS